MPQVNKLHLASWSSNLLILLCLFIFQLPVKADEFIAADHVRIQWLAPERFANNQQKKTIGIFFEVDPEWHVYWRNAGDSGAAPRFVFSGEYLEVGETQWPYPKRLPIAHLTNIGYEGDVAYLFDIELQETISEQLQISVELEWLVCKEECIPGFGTLTLTRPVVGDADQWNSGDRKTLEKFIARVPKNAEEAAENSPWEISSAQFIPHSAQLTLTLSTANVASLAPEIYPIDGNFISAAAPEVTRTNGKFTLRFNTISGVAAPASTGFVVVSSHAVDEFSNNVSDEFSNNLSDKRAWEFPAVTVETRLPQTSVATPLSHSLMVLLLLAFAGGIILNLMPCVFPVLSIKLFSLIQSTGPIQSNGPGAKAHRMREGLLYTAGVLVTFAVLGGIFLSLRAGGAAIGWGFQLQSPLVVLGLALLFWLMALSFIGAFQFGHSLMNLAGRDNGNSSFVTGILAVFVAAPCTGPFMGAALGASATLPAVQAMAIFLGLGAGLAAPFLLLAASPRLASFLPKPGPWMQSLQQFLAFPLFATVLWLLWVLGHLVDDHAWLIGASLLLLISFAVWLAGSARRWLKHSALLLSAAAIIFSIQQVNQAAGTKPNQANQNLVWQAYDTQIINSARSNGQGVFIDFTAAWCITCQVNKKLVLDTSAADEIFTRHNVLRIRADWTRYDENITRALAVLNRNSVPVYVYYPADGSAAEILPQILTIDIVRDLFE